MKNLFNSTLLIYLLLQSCSIYEKSGVGLDQSVDKGKVLIVFDDGREKKFDNVVFKDSIYYGMNPKSTGKSELQQIPEFATSEVFLMKTNPSNNVIYVGYNGYIMVGGGATICYERKISKPLWISIAGGNYPNYENYESKADFKLTYLPGKKSSHVEVGLGFTCAFKSATEDKYIAAYGTTIPGSPASTEILPAITLGYRYQKPGAGPVIRFGIGYAEVYIGVGFRF
jgi:hypothetical protein